MLLDMTEKKKPESKDLLSILDMLVRATAQHTAISVCVFVCVCVCVCALKNI